MPRDLNVEPVLPYDIGYHSLLTPQHHTVLRLHSEGCVCTWGGTGKTFPRQVLPYDDASFDVVTCVVSVRVPLVCSIHRYRDCCSGWAAHATHATNCARWTT